MKLLKSFIFCISSILFSVYAQAQDVSITGKVLDENGLSVPGATVLIKGTTTATATDFDGVYKIKAPSNGTLVFSYVGYATVQEPIKGRTKIDVAFKAQGQDLNEVVVVGYGTQKKTLVTGAVSKLKASAMEDIPNSQIAQVLQGRVTGVSVATNSGEPGSASTVRVRGVTTFNTYGGNQPLWVVDGIVVDGGGIGYVNQSDIESIEVLKDAATLAIYGARSASGVILITTKKGKAGKITVNYTGFSGFSSPGKRLELLNSTQYGAIMNEKSVAAGGPVVYPNLAALGQGTDWQSQIFNTSAQRYSHEFSITGGNDTSTFFASFGQQDQEGIVATPISNFNKKNIRLNSTHKIGKYFTIGENLGWTRQKSMGIGNTNSEFGGPLASAINLDPTTPVVVTDPTVANASPYNNPGVIRDANGNPYGISSVVGQEMSNPLAYIQTRLGNYGLSDDFVGNAYLEIKPIENLVFKTTLGGKLAYWGSQGFTPLFYLNASNKTTQNSLSRSTNQGLGWSIENTLTYSKQIGGHYFNGMLGQGAYLDDHTSGTYVVYSDLPVTSYQDASFNFPTTPDKRDGTAYTGQDHTLSSLFFRLNYNYNEKYIFSGIIRRDGSSRFGENNKYGIFPSFSAGWVISKEAFWNENSSFNMLKLRGGYGVTGNDAIPNNGFLSLIGGGRNYTIGNPGVIQPGNSPDAPANPDLKWESTAQTDIGLDAVFFNDWNATFDVYNKKTSDILQYVDLPGYVGATGSPLGNVADMTNKGAEFELGYHHKFGGLNFSVNGNVSYVENEVTYLGQGIQYITAGAAGFQSMGSITRTAVGHPYNSFYGYQTNGIFQTPEDVASYTNAAGNPIQPDAQPGDFRWKDNNGDGTITDDDKTYIGSSIPNFTYGLTINLDYSGFDFQVFTQGAAGYEIFQGLRRLDIANANYQTDVLSRWTGPGTSNDYPRVTNNDTNGNFSKSSDFYLEDGSYVRLKLVTLGYSLPIDWISKIGAQKFRVYVTGENLLTLTKYTGYDPEIGGDISGIDRGYYPPARGIMFGANLQF